MKRPLDTDDVRHLLASTVDEHSLILGIDIGGTKTAAGVVSSGGTVVSFQVEPTPRDVDAELFDFVVALAEHVLAGYGDKAVAVGVGCGGPMAYPDGVVSPLFIPAWRAFPLRQRLADVFNLPIVVDNDANAFALGEALHGAGRGTEFMLGVVVSTGVGGGIVIDGQVLHGATGNAGHIGHVIVSTDGPRCTCGAIGCLTAYASGTGLVARARAGIAAATPTILAQLAANDLTGQAIVVAASHGDAFASQLMRDAGVALARGIVDAANLLDLERVVLGGGLLQSGDSLLTALRAEVHERARLPFTRNLDIRTSTGGSQAGVIGAAALCFQHQVVR